MDHSQPPLRLRLSGEALISNWRWLNAQSGSAACGAAVKADGYGLGAVEVARRLRSAGCKDFFVATWVEAAALANAGQGDGVAVLHGVRPDDMGLARTLPMVRPVLNTAAQVARWRDYFPGRSCDVMIDTGMNRLGLSVAEAGSSLLDGLDIDTVMSHLASADEDSPMNERQRAAFVEAAANVCARRRSLANSAGICLGSAYAFDLTRPGLALYGAVPRAEAAGHIQQVAFPEAEVLQCRTVRAGETVGYNATWRAPRDLQVAIINLGYADGYLRAFSDRGMARTSTHDLPVVGRVSMDLVALAVPDDGVVVEGQWVGIDYDLHAASRQSGLSPYELLTGLGQRYRRFWRKAATTGL
jgi:alanine racemase